MLNYTPTEFMVTSSARALAGKRIVFVGVGLPNIACNLAQHTVAPDLELIYESGVVGAKPARLPLSIGDPTLVKGSNSVCPMSDLFMYYLQAGRVEVAFLGAAQIDRYGNINTSVIGDYHNPKIRLPGSGGACEIAIHAQKIFIIIRQKKRAFVEKLDFQTSPGFLNGDKVNRKNVGIPGSGPRIVVTDMAIFNFDQETGEMVLEKVRPGVTVEDVKSEVGWPLKVSRNIRESEPPTENELKIIREELDPEGIVIV